MRVRATTTVAAVIGAVALSALAVPAAQAAPAGPAVTFSNVKVSSKTVVVGPTAKVTVSASYTVTKPANLSAASFDSGPILYRGSTLNVENRILAGDNPGTCTAASATVLKCTAKIQFRPARSGEYDDLINSDAGTWNIGALAINDSGYTAKGGFGTVKLLRASKLTADATPEPVKKGKTLTVTGKLSRANWDSNTYAGYSAQPVKLQFRKKGASAYTTVKTVKTSTTGALKTTVQATADGYFRYTFAGTSTTPAATAAGDFVDVR
ncbi:hypothetical protein [Streptomyces sp. NPDC088766]|uniref:hypothetical protein n=1 Tax=Streptomyces sp. NPDC088766 TaxID=3365893 RepID=UPI003804E21C